MYTEYVGLGIPADSAVALQTCETEMLVPNCIAAYGRKVVSRPFLMNDTFYETRMIMMGIFRPIGSFYSFTVCRLEQYLKKLQRKVHFAPIDSSAVAGPALLITIYHQNGHAVPEMNFETRMICICTQVGLKHITILRLFSPLFIPIYGHNTTLSGQKLYFTCTSQQSAFQAETNQSFSVCNVDITFSI